MAQPGILEPKLLPGTAQQRVQEDFYGDLESGVHRAVAMEGVVTCSEESPWLESSFPVKKGIKTSHAVTFLVLFMLETHLCGHLDVWRILPCFGTPSTG